MQLETYVTMNQIDDNNSKSNSNNNRSTNGNEQKIVLIRLEPTVQHLIDILTTKEQGIVTIYMIHTPYKYTYY